MSAQFTFPCFCGIAEFFPHPFYRNFARLAVALCGTLLAGTLVAQEKLSLATLNAWHATSGVAVADPKLGTVAVPPGGELARTFDAGSVSIRLVSHPYFSPSPAGWPALEVGSASLTFVRDKTGGGLVLLGDKPLSLPFAIQLGSDGRSTESLDFTLGYDQTGHLATLVLTGQTFTLAATAPAGPLTVVVSAGAEQPWTLDNLEIQSVPIAPALATGSTVPTPSPSATPSVAAAATDTVAPGTQNFDNSLALFQARNIAAAEKILFGSNLAQPGTGAWALESGIKLMFMATSLANRHDAANACAVTILAAAMLQDAETRLLIEKRPVSASRAQALIGTLSEFILRDRAVAQKAYQAALRDDPGAIGAQNAIARL